MPRELKPNVKLVVSVLASEQEGDVGARREDADDLARRIWPESLVGIGPLDETSAAGLLDAWLREAGRALQPDQAREVLDKFAGCPLSLYLKLAPGEARRWKSWESVSEPLSDTVEAILEQLLASLERPENHGSTLGNRSLGYLATGRTGLRKTNYLMCFPGTKMLREILPGARPSRRSSRRWIRFPSLCGRVCMPISTAT